MKANHRNLAAKVNLVYNLYPEKGFKKDDELNLNKNSERENYNISDFCFDYKKIEAIKKLRSERK